jgi:hypothetical protein
MLFLRLPLWPNGQSSCLNIQRSRVRFLALPHFLRSSGPENGSISIVRIIQGLLAAPLYMIEINGRGDPLRLPDSCRPYDGGDIFLRNIGSYKSQTG